MIIDTDTDIGNNMNIFKYIIKYVPIHDDYRMKFDYRIYPLDEYNVLFMIIKNGMKIYMFN